MSLPFRRLALEGSRELCGASLLIGHSSHWVSADVLEITSVLDLLQSLCVRAVRELAFRYPLRS